MRALAPPPSALLLTTALFALVGALVGASGAATARPARPARRPPPPDDAPPADPAPPAPVRAVSNLSRGLRFEIKLTAIAQAPSDPNVIYVGTEHGRVHISRDGGQSWEESTALVRRGAFYGAIRKQRPMSPIGVDGMGLAPYSDTRAAGFVLPTSLFDELGAYSGLEGVDETRDLGPGNAAARELTGLRALRSASPGSEVREHFSSMTRDGTSGGGGGGGGGGSDLAVGLRSGSPRLAYQVRRKRGWGIGINLQQTLALRSAPATGVWFFDVDPDDPDRVLAATADGLRLSRDGGYSWPLVLTGPTKYERAINHLARDPRTPTTIWAGTGRGLHVSVDDGESWDPIEHPFVFASDVRWIDFDPADPDTVWIGVTWGLLKTTDRGKSFGVAFRSPWPPQALARQVQVDPHDARRIYLATADGLMLSRDRGATFERAGGLLFVGADIKCLSPGAAPGHLIAVTPREVWETRDAGETWQIAFFGAVQWQITYGMFELGRPETMLVLTEAEVLRFGPAAARAPASAALVDRARRRLAGEPSQAEVLTAALKQANLYRPDLLAYRARANAAGYLPRVTAGGSVYRAPWQRLFVNEQFSEDGRFREPVQGQAWFVGVVASWDLQRTVFDRAEAPIARIGRTNSSAEWSLRSTVINMYQERRRLIIESMLGADDPRATLMRALRIEELTATLNALAGDLLEPAPAL